MTLPKNKLPDSLTQSSSVERMFDDASKERALEVAAFELQDIIKKRSWKAVSTYSQVMAILRKKGSRLGQKAIDIVHYFNQQHSNQLNPSQFHSRLTVPAAEIQRQLFQKTVEQHHDTVVILHLFYTELWQDVSRYLKNIPVPFDLYVSIPDGKEDTAAEAVLRDYQNAFIYRSPNRGRDVAPFVAIYSAIASLDYQYLCKVHTKKSHHLHDGDAWRDYLFQELIGSADRVQAIFDNFQQDPTLGMIVPKGFLYSGIDINSMMNQAVLDQLSERLGVGYNRFRFDYPAGSMFWCRAGCLRKLGEAGIETTDFPEEHGQLNRTLAHGIERYFGILTMDSGYKLQDTAHLNENCHERSSHDSLKRHTKKIIS